MLWYNAGGLPEWQEMGNPVVIPGEKLMI